MVSWVPRRGVGEMTVEALRGEKAPGVAGWTQVTSVEKQIQVVCWVVTKLAD